MGQIYNIGSEPEYEMSVLEVAKYLIKNIKKTDDFQKYIKHVKDRPFNDKRYFITNKKLKNLGWSQKIKFEDGINNLINN